ncbi:MAG: hypothetical protein HC938_13440 [Nitrospira sp.]|nr:hypothetical protein [Nitrospira sp.]
MKVIRQRLMAFGLLCLCIFPAFAQQGEFDAVSKTDASDSGSGASVLLVERPVDDMKDAKYVPLSRRSIRRRLLITSAILRFLVCWK